MNRYLLLADEAIRDGVSNSGPLTYERLRELGEVLLSLHRELETFDNYRYDVGYDRGNDEGYNYGYDYGHRDGYDTGYEEGYEKGLEEGAKDGHL